MKKETESNPNHEQLLVKSEKSTKQSRMLHNMENQSNFDTTVAVQNNSVSAALQDLGAQIKSMMTVTNVRSANGRGFIATCNIFGKESPSNDLPQHIESNHISGVSHACNICDKTSRSRNGLASHKKIYHKTLLQE